jgi:hypothetical protein
MHFKTGSIRLQEKARGVVDDKSKRQFLTELKEGYTKIDIVHTITKLF